MNAKVRRQLKNRKKRIAWRLERIDRRASERPELAASNIHYEIADRTRAIATGGIGAAHLLINRLGLERAINDRLGLLKVHLPYHESDHVLNIAYNLLAGGTRLEHLELLRNDEGYLNALGARRIPDLCAAAGGTPDADMPRAARPRLGGISFLHRFGSALNHHVHLRDSSDRRRLRAGC